MTNTNHSTTLDDAAIERAEWRASWETYAAEYAAAKAAADAQTEIDLQHDAAGARFEPDPAIITRLLEARDTLANVYAPHWAGVGLKASIFAEANEDDDWRERIAHGSPNYWLAQIIDFATAAGDGEPSETDPALVMQLIGAAECAMRAFLAHPDGFAEWGCNPSALETNVGMIAGIQQDARRLASDNPAHERAAAAVLNAVWFGGHLGGGVLHIEARGTGPDLRPWMIAAGAVRQRGAPAEAGDMRAAALATLAEAAAHWAKADKLADAYGQTETALTALVNVAERIMREAAAVMAETREALRSKAQILVRIEGPAFRDEASMTYAGQALLLSLLDDLTREDDAA